MFTDEELGVIETHIDSFLECNDKIKIINVHTVVMGTKYSTIIFYKE